MLHTCRNYSLLLLALVALAGCAQQQHPKKIPALPVTTTIVREGSLPVVVDTLGQAIASHSVTIIPQVSGILQEVAVHSGQVVHQGQLLFQIDPRTFAAQVSEDQANLQGEIAQERYDETQVKAYLPLLKKDYVMRQTVQQAQAQAQTAAASVAADQAALQAARIQLAETRITAPISGSMGILSVKSGNLVTAGSTELGTINQIHPIKIQFSLPEGYLSDVERAIGQKSKSITVWDENHAHLLGRGPVTAMNNSVNANSATVTAQATLPNHKSRIWPGEYVQIAFTAKLLQQVEIIPANALQQGVSGPFVYTIVQGKAVLHPVRFLGQNANKVAIAAPDLLGKAIIVGAPTQLHPGAKVRVVSS